MWSNLVTSSQVKKIPTLCALPTDSLLTAEFDLLNQFANQQKIIFLLRESSKKYALSYCKVV